MRRLPMMMVSLALLAVSRGAAAAETPDIGVPYVLAAASYEGRVEGDVARFTVGYELETLKDGLTIPFLGPDVVVTGMTAKGGGLALVPDTGYRLHAAKRGLYRFSLAGPLPLLARDGDTGL